MKIALIALCLIFGCVASERIQLVNLSPEEAQKYIADQGIGLTYARKLGEQPLVQLRSLYGDDKKFYVNGRAIDNPEDYIQEDYLASQFHGQDGLGRAMFGYTDWNQGRMEARNANGEVRGSYQYVDADGENIVVNYWADNQGFHQTDNRPKVVLEPVQETEEVMAARRAHELAWKEAALAAKVSPDPKSDFYNANANRLFEEQSKKEQAEQLLAKEATYQDTYKPRQVDIEEPTGEPRGFFYSFDYPVHLIREDPARRRSLENSNKFKRDDAKVSEAAPSVPQEKISPLVKLEREDTERVDAVHDAQVPKRP